MGEETEERILESKEEATSKPAETKEENARKYKLFR